MPLLLLLLLLQHGGAAAVEQLLFSMEKSNLANWPGSLALWHSGFLAFFHSCGAGPGWQQVASYNYCIHVAASCYFIN